MLILSRKKDETLVIRHDVRIKVLSVQGNQVKIGIEAPREVRILRDELIEADAQADKPAAAADGQVSDG